MTARDEILRAVHVLAANSADGTFSAQEVVDYLKRHGTTYADSTIRTHVTSRMCANAPSNHAVRYDDLHSLGNGRYQIN